ncbi:hypothetical protein BH20BAC1_BH20BAC1_13550 [soil metagenome]
MSTEILNPTTKKNMSFKLGVPEKISISSRYVEFNRSNAIRDVYDALVELITNSDDSVIIAYLKIRKEAKMVDLY